MRWQRDRTAVNRPEVPHTGDPVLRKHCLHSLPAFRTAIQVDTSFMRK
jgi:hypothetical protein